MNSFDSTSTYCALTGDPFIAGTSADSPDANHSTAAAAASISMDTSGALLDSTPVAHNSTGPAVSSPSQSPPLPFNDLDSNQIRPQGDFNLPPLSPSTQPSQPVTPRQSPALPPVSLPDQSQTTGPTSSVMRAATTLTAFTQERVERHTTSPETSTSTRALTNQDQEVS